MGFCTKSHSRFDVQDIILIVCFGLISFHFVAQDKITSPKSDSPQFLQMNAVLGEVLCAQYRFAQNKTIISPRFFCGFFLGGGVGGPRLLHVSSDFCVGRTTWITCPSPRDEGGGRAVEVSCARTGQGGAPTTRTVLPVERIPLASNPRPSRPGGAHTSAPMW